MTSDESFVSVDQGMKFVLEKAKYAYMEDRQSLIAAVSPEDLCKVQIEKSFPVLPRAPKILHTDRHCNDREYEKLSVNADSKEVDLLQNSFLGSK